ncbi:hypothetical protein L9F63_007834, partial [Diploptera punctata]
MFDAQTNSMICLNGQVLKREAIHNSSNARFLMDSMFDFAERLNSLDFVIAPDRPGLRNTELIERMQGKLKAALQLVVSQNHPGHANICHELMKKIPDLRTLNTLHSEKLLAFKMTEQQQQLQQQQQQQHHHLWGTTAEEESNMKSPLGSVSSTESVCSASSAPLLAATLAGGICPHRHRANSGSTSGDDDMTGLPHHPHHGLTITTQHHHRFQRKLDSPSDSGIESGSAPTSVCSSPRSSLEDKDDDKHHSGNSGNSHIDDMPVLKRVLQAPPLYDTNSLMDEAYKPHKKFRACRNKDSAEAEPMIVHVSPPPPPHPIPPQHHSSPQLHLHLTSNTHQNQSSSSSSTSSSASLLSSTHSTLAKSLMESPRMTAEQMKRTDIIHNYIMRADIASPTAATASTTTASGYKMNNGNLLVCASTAPGSSYHYIPQQQPPQQQQMVGSTTPPAIASCPPSPSSTGATPAVISSPKMMELQVDIADSQQPLNLSKKSPSPSPHPMASPATTAHHHRLRDKLSVGSGMDEIIVTREWDVCNGVTHQKKKARWTVRL